MRGNDPASGLARSASRGELGGDGREEGRLTLPAFRLQFPASDIAALAARFPEIDDSGTHHKAAAARARGYYTRAEFLLVCAWKTPRSRPKVQANGAAAIRAATAIALSPASTERARIEALTSLEGVGVPTASTLLYFAFPGDYPILDVRALHALGHKPRSVYPASYWLAYLEACRDLAARHGVSLRMLDKALWQWSKEQSLLARASGASRN
jgi:hypothetical protein